MDLYSGSEPSKYFSFHIGKEKNDQPTQEPVSVGVVANPIQTDVMEAEDFASIQQPVQQTERMDQGLPQLQRSPSQSLISRFCATDSSGSDGSCGTYITCKMSQTEKAAAKDFAKVTEIAQRESISEAMELIPCIQQYEYG